MTHKTHPKVLRIKRMDDWENRGFYGKKFPKQLEQDFFIRKFLLKKLEEAAVDSVKIERFPAKLNIIIKSARPGLIIGRGGSGAEELKKELKGKLMALRKKRNGVKVPELRIEIQEIKNPWTSAALIGQAIAKQVVKRVPFRRVIKQSLENVMENKDIKGAKIEIAGRLDGNEIARREWLKKGRLPRQTLRADIEYAHTSAYCTYGTIGIKVWLYKGDKFD
ncbi:30S ribosomal protein S3 [Candidatus Parcubacteria bacterium]|nr:30S ribosomal protein S3 [Patescibacteria group bacterium]MBU4466766.1 30S ribosomal protein S3 [Patescibacteria group bacterium]MCG2688246.1 30S ribosomal protein S3 [Candidatus Parcubacteria bacterium]